MAREVQDSISIDLGDPEQRPYEMELRVVLPLVLDAEAITWLTNQASDMFKAFTEKFDHLAKK